MTIIVEDGSQVTDSNSYSTRAEYIAYALTVGVTIADSETSDMHLVKSAEYIAQHESNLKGEKVTRDQSMAYPRTGLYLDGWSWDSDEIPTLVKDCQLAYALDINAGEDLYNRPANPEQIVTKERVEGAVEVQYSDTGSGQKASKTSAGDSLLASLMINSGMLSVPLVRA